MIMVGKLRATFALGAVLLALTACGGTVQESLGLGKRSPDEFQVVRRAPLILPPDYSLRPPEPGSPGPAAQDTASQAEQILTGQPRLPPVDTTQSQGELTLLAQTGSGEQAAPTDPTIYRLYEALNVYGPTIKELIHEEFGDGIMSAINFKMDVQRRTDPTGDRVVITLDGKFLDYNW